MRRAVLLGLVLLLTACNGCASAPLTQPYGALPMEPEAWFANLGEEMTACLTKAHVKIKRTDYRNVRWFVVRPGIMGMDGEMPGDGTVWGKWSWPNKIFLDARAESNSYIVAHELGHFILQEGDAAHPVIALCLGG